MHEIGLAVAHSKDAASRRQFPDPSGVPFFGLRVSENKYQGREQ